MSVSLHHCLRILTAKPLCHLSARIQSWRLVLECCWLIHLLFMFLYMREIILYLYLSFSMTSLSMISFFLLQLSSRLYSMTSSLSLATHSFVRRLSCFLIWAVVMSAAMIFISLHSLLSFLSMPEFFFKVGLLQPGLQLKSAGGPGR